MKLGELLVDHDIPPYDGTETWVELLLRDPGNRAAIAHEVRAVAEEIAADPRYGDDEALGPDDAGPRPLPRVRPQARLARVRESLSRIRGRRPASRFAVSTSDFTSLPVHRISDAGLRETP